MKTPRSALLPVLACSFFLALAAGCLLTQTGDEPDGGYPLTHAGGAFDGRRVLLVGIDGCRSDCLLASDTPNFDALAAGNAAVSYDVYAGGLPGTASQQRTMSGPGWTSLLTGVWANKHGVESNAFFTPRLDAYPSLFTRLRSARPDALLASFVNWAPINNVIVGDADIERQGLPDEEVAALAAYFLSTENADLVFVAFDDVDAAGHGFGFSPDTPEYMAAIEEADRLLGVLVAALRARPNYAAESWSVVVTTDHGGLGTGHGGQSPEERTVFLLDAGPFAVAGTYSPGPGLVAVAPTVLACLGVPIDPAWGLDAAPFGFGE